jgi:tetratricopeptide (TPR) repeat protein
MELVRKHFPIIALVAITLVVYLNALPGKFVWDDEDFVYNNVYVRHLSLFPYSINQNLIAGAGKISNYYRPLLLFSFALDWQIWHGYPVGFHLTNILLHSGAAVLAFLLFKRLLDDKLSAFVAAGFFAVHPVQTEAVTYISGRGDSLYSLLLLGSLLLYLKALRPSTSDRAYLASLGLMTASLFAKELAIVGLPLLLLLDVVRAKKLPGGEWLRERARWLWPYALITGAYLILRLTALNFANSLNFYGEQNLYTQSLTVRLATFTKVLVTYLGLIIFPKNLHMERTIPLITNVLNPVVVIVTLALALAVAVSIRLLRKGRPLPFLALGWFLINLTPTSGIVPINGIIYEHFLYLALLGPFVLIGRLISLAWQKFTRPPVRYVLVGVVSLWWLALGMRTISRNADWRDPITFYRHLLHYSQSARVYNNLGMAYADLGDHQKAITFYQKAIALADVYPQTHHNLGNSLEALGRVNEATASYERALEINPRFAPAYEKLTNLYLREDKLEKALETLNRAIKAFPQNQGYRSLRDRLSAARPSS